MAEPNYRSGEKSSFDPMQLRVYRKALAFVARVEEAAPHFPRGRAELRMQLIRASCSIVLNIAEGCGEFSPAEKARFYRMARRSATECLGVIDICTTNRWMSEASLARGRDDLITIASMLLGLAKAQERSCSTAKGR